MLKRKKDLNALFKLFVLIGSCSFALFLFAAGMLFFSDSNGQDILIQGTIISRNETYNYRKSVGESEFVLLADNNERYTLKVKFSLCTTDEGTLWSSNSYESSETLILNTNDSVSIITKSNNVSDTNVIKDFECSVNSTDPLPSYNTIFSDEKVTTDESENYLWECEIRYLDTASVSGKTCGCAVLENKNGESKFVTFKNDVLSGCKKGDHIIAELIDGENTVFKVKKIG